MRQQTIQSSPITLKQNQPSFVFYLACKRMLDILIALIGLLILSPLMLMCALAIKLDSAGPVIFAQERIGVRRIKKNGRIVWQVKPFTVYKFRTMQHRNNPTGHVQLMQTFIRKAYPATLDAESYLKQIQTDPRITRVGKILRKTSLDELPQFWNVLIGDMSLVGPRPAISYEVEAYEKHHLHRLAAKPGITGYWQVTARNSVSFEEMVELDVWYVQHQSLWVDFKIICRTPYAVLRGKGAM